MLPHIIIYIMLIFIKYWFYKTFNVCCPKLINAKLDNIPYVNNWCGKNTQMPRDPITQYIPGVFVADVKE